MTASRDPRVDPQPGDVLWKDGITRTVNYVDEPRVGDANARHLTVRSSWTQKSPFGRKMHNGRNAYPSLAAWRRWAKNATVKEST